MGIEPTYSAWKAEVLPLNYTRAVLKSIRALQHSEPEFPIQNARFSIIMVEGGGLFGLWPHPPGCCYRNILRRVAALSNLYRLSSSPKLNK